MNEYYYIPDNTVAIREITVGIWMALSTFLTFMFAWYFCKYATSRPWDTCTKAAFALFLLSLSVSIKSALIWAQWKSFQIYGHFLFLWGNTEIFAVSSFLSIIACLMCIHIFYPTKHRTFVQMLVGVCMIGIPVAVYYLF